MSHAREPGSAPTPQSATPLGCAAPFAGARSAGRPRGGRGIAGVGSGAGPGSRLAAAGGVLGAAGCEAPAP